MALKIRVTNKTRSILALNSVKRKVSPVSTTEFEISVAELEELRPLLVSYRDRNRIHFTAPSQVAVGKAVAEALRTGTDQVAVLVL
tara:strand:- start:2061 stop:2318 length:258 start_codon:yes stop_codon:yes gene_type:complete